MPDPTALERRVTDVEGHWITFEKVVSTALDETAWLVCSCSKDMMRAPQGVLKHLVEVTGDAARKMAAEQILAEVREREQRGGMYLFTSANSSGRYEGTILGLKQAAEIVLYPRTYVVEESGATRVQRPGSPTPLAEQIAREHRRAWPNGRVCDCGASIPTLLAERAHIATVTERAVREQVEADIEGLTVTSGATGTGAWSVGYRSAIEDAAQIARGATDE